jgi:hypothetical protein
MTSENNGAETQKQAKVRKALNEAEKFSAACERGKRRRSSLPSGMHSSLQIGKRLSQDKLGQPKPDVI